MPSAGREAALLLSLASAVLPAAARAQATAEPLLLGIEINGRVRADASIVIRREGRLYLRTADLCAWRIKTDGLKTLDLEGEPRVATNDLAGASAVIDESRQVLALTLPAEAFQTTVLGAETPRTQVSPSALTAFVNYDVALQDLERLNAASAYVETGVSDDWGLALNTFTIDTTARRNVVRLDSFLVRDNPDRLTRLVVGDTLTGAHPGRVR